MNMSVGLNLFLACLFAVIVYTNLDALANLLIVNGVIQLTLFAVVACIPFLRTKRVSYVDIAWPFGVALIGLQILLISDADFIRKMIVGSIYLFIGLRMGLGALFMAKKTGVIFKTEFPRYKYRRMVLEQSGSKHIDAHLLAEIMAQGFANITVLALPGFLIATNSSESISSLEIIGICLWMSAYLLESIADGQKLLFISKNKRGVCNIGLWKYSRHPNYFSEWLVWTGLVIAAIPSWLALSSSESLTVWICLGVGSLSASFMMYITLVHLTGAIPAEYYSVQKRKEYKEYQEKTNMFFPWFSR
jgi:steroid 5-alpha reductase family enzyme